ncbi:acyltransferase [Acinetobacter venetianus]|uniref:acyltransferase n=1 Tax=Acinetobacter venetianus TaxID=52133 RepID=UPI003F904764
MFSLLNRVFNFLFWLKGVKRGENTIIKKGVFFQKKNLVIGRNVYIGPDSYIHAGGGVIIGNGTIIGPKVKIWSVNHDYNTFEILPYTRKVINSPVQIGKGCWIGLDVRICPNVTIGDGVVIAMGSVVTKDIPSFSIVGGNPAKVLKSRYTTEEEKLKLEELVEREIFYGKQYFKN